MKTLLNRLNSLLLLLLVYTTTYAQQGNIWYFGNKAGLDFNSGSPVAITNGALSTNEGCASISDASGNLLFYTDGVRVWDATHSQITSALNGDASSTQSAVAVPKPGSPNNYFIFTMDAQYPSGANDGMNYTEIEVIGGIVSVVSLNNNLLTYTDCTEKIAASCHANGTDYWVTTVKRSGEFVSWPVTGTGVGGPVSSAPINAIPCPTGTSPAERDDRVGYMKINSQGTKLVLARRSTLSDSEAFDFDNSTGKVTANLGVYNSGVVYGVEFSANGDYFYTSQNFRRVFMYNTSSLTPTLLHTRPTNNREDWLGALQMGPDGNIYVANGYEGDNSSNIDMISNVENGSPTYNNDFITLPAGHYSRLGLPDLVSCFVPVISPPRDCGVEAQFDIKAPSAEEGCGYQFTDNSALAPGSQIVSWHWTFGDGNSSNEQNPTHFYTQPGSYQVCLTVTAFNGEECCVSTFCEEVIFDQPCDDPCNIEHSFDWFTTDECGQCAIQFVGQLAFSNKPIVAWLYDFGDGTSGTGQNPTHVYTSPGSYEVCVTVIGSYALPDGDGSDCCVFTFCETIDVDCAGDPRGRTAAAPSSSVVGDKQGNASPQDELNVYPNPARDVITLERRMPTDQKITIRLLDHTGKVYWQKKDIVAPEGTWDYSIQVDVPDGIYLLMMEGEGFTEVKKVRLTQ